MLRIQFKKKKHPCEPGRDYTVSPFTTNLKMYPDAISPDAETEKKKAWDCE